MLLGVSAPTLSRPRPEGRAHGRPSGLRPHLATRTWERVGAAVVCICAAAGFLLYPTYPNYDSVYSLLWGRELLHLEPLSFQAYRAPTEHPLAIAIGAILSLFGNGADRLFVALMVASFVALVFGLYALGRTAFTPLVGLVAAVLIITRFDFPFLAARGYIDPLYLALVIWAAVLELRRPRRGWVVLLLLMLGAMLRPEAWLLAGLYVLWAGWHATWRRRIAFAAMAAAGPLIWALTDFLVTHNALYSFTGTSEPADELGRNKGVGAVPQATWSFLIDLAKFPVVLGGIVGVLLALLLTPRRLVMPAVLFVCGVGTFALVGAGGLSVISRYLLVPSLIVMVLCGVAVGGFTMLRERSRIRRVWALGALALVVFGIGFTATRVSVARLDSELSFRGDAHDAFMALIEQPAFKRGLACGPVWTPNHKLVPDTRWYLGLPEDQVIARSSTQRVPDKGVVILVHGRQALFKQALVTAFDDPADSLPPPGFRRVAVSAYYAAYVRC
jgi:MFS family permease